MSSLRGCSPRVAHARRGPAEGLRPWAAHTRLGTVRSMGLGGQRIGDWVKLSLRKEEERCLFKCLWIFFPPNTQITDQKPVLIANKLNSLKIPQVKGRFTHGTTHAEYFLPLPSMLHPILFQTTSATSEDHFALSSYQRPKSTI